MGFVLIVAAFEVRIFASYWTYGWTEFEFWFGIGLYMPCLSYMITFSFEEKNPKSCRCGSCAVTVVSIIIREEKDKNKTKQT